LNKEIEILEGLLPELFDLFDKGIPETWFKFESASGRITKHVQLVLRGIDYVYGGTERDGVQEIGRAVIFMIKKMSKFIIEAFNDGLVRSPVIQNCLRKRAK